MHSLHSTDKADFKISFEEINSRKIVRFSASKNSLVTGVIICCVQSKLFCQRNPITKRSERWTSCSDLILRPLLMAHSVFYEHW